MRGLKQLPGFAAKFGHPLAGSSGWSHLYSFSWFYTCSFSSVVYFALSSIGDYAKEEKSMSFETLGNLVILQGEEQSIPDIPVNVTVDEK